MLLSFGDSYILQDLSGGVKTAVWLPHQKRKPNTNIWLVLGSTLLSFLQMAERAELFSPG
jgi:hypothetical protein